MSISSALKTFNLWDLQNQKPLLIVFLRHLGCTYCREAIADVVSSKREIQQSGAQVVFVHMSSDEKFKSYLKSHDASDFMSVSDPDKKLYEAFHLKRGNLVELFGPKVLARAFFDKALLKHGVGIPEGDPLQMPGTFLVQNGEIKKSFVHKSIADKPDYCEMVK